MLEIQLQKQNGWLNVRKCDIPKIQTYLEGYKEGRWFNVKITEAVREKTHEQLGYHYAVIVPTVNRVLVALGYTIEVMGVEVPIDEGQTDELLKHFCARLDNKGNLRIHNPDRYPNRKVMRKRDMNIKQASQFIDNEINWSDAVLNCKIPEPTRC